MQQEKKNILIATAMLLGIAVYICVMLIFLLHEEPSEESTASQRQEARAPKKEEVTAVPAEAVASSDAESADVKAPTSPDKLNLSGTETTDAGLARRLEGLTSLESLQLGATRITDAGLGHLKNLTALQSLCVHNTQVTDAGLAHLKGLTRLQSLCLHNTQVSDASLAYLKNLTSLETLRLEVTKVTDEGLAHLKDLTFLKTLYLGGTQVTDAGLAHVKNLTRLQRICFHKTEVTDAGLAHLKGLTRLQSLCLNDTQVSDAGLTYLKGLTSLRQLKLLGTKVSTAGVAELKRALPNCRISGPRTPVAGRAESPLIGKLAPSFTLQDLNGKQVSLSDFKGKVVLLDFWATWCGPCVRAIPHVESLHKKYKNQGLVVIGINNERDHAKVKAFAKARMSYIILLDADKQFRQYGARSIPMAFYIDKYGMIRYCDVGFGPGKEKEIEQKVKELLAGREEPKGVARPVRKATEEEGKVLAFDDFESYNDLDPTDPNSNRIFNTWIDGYKVPTNGSLVGYHVPSFAERSIVHSGEQSMPFFYANTGGAAYSEAERTFVVPQNWTVAGATTLVLYFYGTDGNTGQLYVKVNGTKVVYDGDAADIAKVEWKQWNIDLAPLGAGLQNVTKLSIGIDGNGTSGTLYFDDIRLYRLAP